MAFLFKNFLRGIIGDAVLKGVRGQQQVQQKRGKGSVKQTKNSIRSANTFGMASALAGQIRKWFINWTRGLADPDMVNRMNYLLVEILNYCRDPKSKKYSFDEDSFHALTGLNFNIRSPLHKSLGIGPAYEFDDGILSISVGDEGSPLKIKYPKEHSSCDIIVKMAVFNLIENRKMEYPPVQHTTLKKLDPPKNQVKFTFEAPPGCLCIAAMFVRFFGSMGGRDILFNTKEFSPGGICAAVYTPLNGKTWSKKDWTNIRMKRFIMS